MSHAEKLIRSTLPISQIIVKLNGEHPSLMLGDYNPYNTSEEQLFKVFYHGKTDDTWITYEPRQPIKIKDRGCIDVLCDDLETLLNSESEQLDKFSVKFCICEDEEEEEGLMRLQKVYDRIGSMFKKINSKLVSLAVDNINQVRELHVCFNSRALNIEFEFIYDRYETPAITFRDILEFEQMKLIKSLCVRFKVDNISIDDLRAIKKTAISFENECVVVLYNSQGFNIDEEGLNELFGPPLDKFNDLTCRSLFDGVECDIYDTEIVIQQMKCFRLSNEYNNDDKIGSGLQVLMTDLILRNILQHVGLTTILALRRVSWGVLNCIDRIKPDLKIEVLVIQMRSIDFLIIEVLDESKHNKHSYQTAHNEWYNMLCENGDLLSLRDNLHPIYEFYYFANATRFDADAEPNASPVLTKRWTRKELCEWFERRANFSNDLRRNLVNQRSPIENLKLTLPLFGDTWHYFEFDPMIPTYTEFLELEEKIRHCELCQETENKHRNEFRKLLQKYRWNFECESDLIKQESYVQRVDVFIKYFGDNLKSIGHKIQVKELNMQACNQNTVMHVLPYLDTRVLRSISIQIPVQKETKVPCDWIEPLEINEICELEQWKNARMLEIEHVINTTGMKHLGHFSEADVKLTRMTTEGILCLKAEFLLSNNFEKFKASFETSDIDESIYETEYLGLPFRRPINPRTNQPSIWYFKYPGTDDYLHILYYEMRKRIVFTRVKASSVPMNLVA